MALVKSETLIVRLEPELLAAVEQVRVGNQVPSKSETARLLIRRGILAVAQDDGKVPTKVRKLRKPKSRAS